jgi:hypothetical protein
MKLKDIVVFKNRINKEQAYEIESISKESDVIGICKIMADGTVSNFIQATKKKNLKLK